MSLLQTNSSESNGLKMMRTTLLKTLIMIISDHISLQILMMPNLLTTAGLLLLPFILVAGGRIDRSNVDFRTIPDQIKQTVSIRNPWWFAITDQSYFSMHICNRNRSDLPRIHPVKWMKILKIGFFSNKGSISAGKHCRRAILYVFCTKLNIGVCDNLNIPHI